MHTLTPPRPWDVLSLGRTAGPTENTINELSLSHTHKWDELGIG